MPVGGWRGGDAGRGGDGRGGVSRRQLPPMVAVLKVWEPDEISAASLTEGSELRLHRCVRACVFCGCCWTHPIKEEAFILKQDLETPFDPGGLNVLFVCFCDEPSRVGHVVQGMLFVSRLLAAFAVS